MQRDEDVILHGLRLWALTLLIALACAPVWAAHGYAIWGTLKYPAGFPHFDYVNPHAPKAGELRLVSNLRVSTFDKYNPFTIKGNAPAYLADMLFESLLMTSADELGSAYGLLAQDVEVSSDGHLVTFVLNPKAKFHNGEPVLAKDVEYSFQSYLGKHTSPGYKTALVDLQRVEVVGERTVRFYLKKANREMPMVLGGLAIFSHRWGQGKPFNQVITDIPIGSGPYKIGTVRFGKDITYVRDPDYWGRNLNVRVGTGNFDRIMVKIYGDTTARLEALKAGEFDLMRFFSAGDWARRVFGPRFRRGELRKGEFSHRLPTGFQSYVLNTRRPFLQDVRVREALGLALDFDWMNRQLFYGAYRQVRGLFGNTDCAAPEQPSAQELALLEPWRNTLGDKVFGSLPSPVRTGDRPYGLRENLRKARDLLSQAGWTYRDGALRNAKNQAMVIEYLDSGEAGAKVMASWSRHVEKLGITLKFRRVDFAIYQERLAQYDFDMISLAYQGTNNPGQEFADMLGSKAADTPDAGNYPGLKSPAVDALISRMVSSRTREELLPACHALERVTMHNHIFIPQWYAPTHRMVYNAWRLGKPAAMPAYASGEGWAMETWWAMPHAINP